MATATATTPQKATTIPVTFVATNPADIEKYETYVERDFVRVDKDGKPDPAYKDYFYKVEAIFPQYFGHGNTADVVTIFNVQKYSASRMVEASTQEGRKFKKPEQVKWLEWNGLDWQVKDADAQFSIRCDEFDKHFKFR